MYDYKLFKWEAIDENSNTFRSITLPKRKIQRRSNLPITAGCYIWLIDDEVYYIGKSSNIRNRLGAHIFAKISGPRSNAIYSTTARDTIVRYLFPDCNHEKFRNFDKDVKKVNQEYLHIWQELEKLINKSKFIIYSTKTANDSELLERELIIKLNPLTNNVLPNMKSLRDDLKVIGIQH